MTHRLAVSANLFYILIHRSDNSNVIEQYWFDISLDDFDSYYRSRHVLVLTLDFIQKADHFDY